MNIKNNIAWFRGWFLFFTPLLYFSSGVFNNIYKVIVLNKDFKVIETRVEIDNGVSDSAGNVYSYSTIINGIEVGLQTFDKKVDEHLLTEKWAYAHPELSNAGIGETPEQIEEKAKIGVWYHPKSGIAYVISEAKYEKEFPASEIIWRNVKWFIGFTILPFYFFCRWIIEWIRVLWERRNKNQLSK